MIASGDAQHVGSTVPLASHSGRTSGACPGSSTHPSLTQAELPESTPPGHSSPSPVTLQSDTGSVAGTGSSIGHASLQQGISAPAGAVNAAQACELAAAQLLLAGKPVEAVRALASRRTHVALSAALQLCAIIRASGQVRP